MMNELKEHGMQLALDAQPVWADDAFETIKKLADCKIAFTSEDVLDIVGLPTGGIGINKNNASGAIMNKAARAGIIRKIGYTQATRKSSRGSVQAVWIGV